VQDAGRLSGHGSGEVQEQPIRPRSGRNLRIHQRSTERDFDPNRSLIVGDIQFLNADDLA
jgi:hypothetical protein